MSSSLLPYALRRNKAIDRYAFIDLLTKVNRCSDISKYIYVGFGGHSLEDFKYIHSQFGIEKMISLELDEKTYERQIFNKPISCIECRLESSRDFISSFDRTDQTIIWLDYVDAADLRGQLEEFQAILIELLPFDIVKITLNANPSSLAPGQGDEEVFKQARLDELFKRIYPLLPTEISTDEMITAEYPNALCKILKLCANLALRGQRDIYFQPLAAFSYADGQQMFTLTGIVLENEQAESFLKETGMNDWKLHNLDWGMPKKINVPDFTFKERLHTDALLPNSKPEEIQGELGILFDKSEQASLRMLETYALFYRHSPQFSKVIL